MQVNKLPGHGHKIILFLLFFLHSEIRGRVEQRLKEFENLQDKFEKETDKASFLRAESSRAAPSASASPTKLSMTDLQTSPFRDNLLRVTDDFEDDFDIGWFDIFYKL